MKRIVSFCLFVFAPAIRSMEAPPAPASESIVKFDAGSFVLEGIAQLEKEFDLAEMSRLDWDAPKGIDAAELERQVQACNQFRTRLAHIFASPYIANLLRDSKLDESIYTAKLITALTAKKLSISSLDKFTIIRSNQSMTLKGCVDKALFTYMSIAPRAEVNFMSAQLANKPYFPPTALVMNHPVYKAYKESHSAVPVALHAPLPKQPSWLEQEID